MSFLDPTSPSSTPIMNASSAATIALPPVVDAVTGISRAPMGLRRTMTLSHDPGVMAGLHRAATGTWNSATDTYDPAPQAMVMPTLSRTPSALPPLSRVPSALSRAPSALPSWAESSGGAEGPPPGLSRAPSAVLEHDGSAMDTVD
jgi:hypothetical protein